MKRVSTYSLALAMAFGASATVAVQPASAMQEDAAEPAFDPSELTPEIRQVAGAAQQALTAETPDLDAAQESLQAAAAGVSNPHEQFFVGQLLLQLSVARQNNGASNEVVIPIQRQGLQLAVDSGLLPAEQHARYWRFLGGMAETPEEQLRAFQAAVDANPADAESQIQLARAKFNAGDMAGGYAAAEQALSAARAAGMEIDQTWFGVPLNAAYQNRNVEQALKYGQMWVETSPSDQSWREALRIYQYAGRLEDQANLDLLRLMRATGSMDAEAYDEYVELAARRGFFGEAMSVYEEGTSAGTLTADAARRAEIAERLEEDRSSLPSLRAEAAGAASGQPVLGTADAFAGYGQYEPAIELYRLALEKGGVDTGTVNLRLARALIEQNRHDEARQALEAVTGNRAGLARYWQIWLDQQAGGEQSAG